MFEASESGETAARCEGAQGAWRGGAWQRARGRGAPVGRGKMYRLGGELNSVVCWCVTSTRGIQY